MLIRRLGLVITTALLGQIAFSTAAAGAPPVECVKRDALTGVCLVVVSPPDTTEGVPVSSGEGNGGGTAPPDPCTYVPAEPQPPGSHPAWESHTPADGSIYLRVCPRPDGFGSGYRVSLVFVANGTDPPAGPPIDPAVLAEQAIALMELRGPLIRTAPPSGSTSGLVGLPVWMWAERAPDTVGPVQRSASAAGVTVVAVGQVSRVVWDMGDGTTVVCGIGTPYSPGAEGESPDCGHTYAQASSRHAPRGGAWPITATSMWTITWSGGGLSGTETMELSSSGELYVGELHVLNQDGGG